MEGVTNPMNMTKYVLEGCIQLQPQIEDKIGRKLTRFVPLLYRSQTLIGGAIYLVKILINDQPGGQMLNECIHVNISKPLIVADLGKFGLNFVAAGKTVLEEIEVSELA